MLDYVGEHQGQRYSSDGICKKCKNVKIEKFRNKYNIEHTYMNYLMQYSEFNYYTNDKNINIFKIDFIDKITQIIQEYNNEFPKNKGQETKVFQKWIKKFLRIKI